MNSGQIQKALPRVARHQLDLAPFPRLLLHPTPLPTLIAMSDIKLDVQAFYTRAQSLLSAWLVRAAPALNAASEGDEATSLLGPSTSPDAPLPSTRVASLTLLPSLPSLAGGSLNRMDPTRTGPP